MTDAVMGTVLHTPTSAYRIGATCDFQEMGDDYEVVHTSQGYTVATPSGDVLLPHDAPLRFITSVTGVTRTGVMALNKGKIVLFHRDEAGTMGVDKL